ncbi:DUF4118 domain-containing protein [Dactylosporangium sp. AC04546]|uniref:sensor histidine kinase n=1 Tax=Dactylosporangium sp. AC04546 TaxID=2862460 RepID=UPI001EDEB3A5|nr:DUF4118 domain-containing protein [Dactylosporangium sp. AC04546]WVK79550.1 DUF4118 domain-containing protein [Dactylosporangium sp. AC04546]
MPAHLAAWLVRPKPPPLALGIVVGVLLVAVETLLVYSLGFVASRGTVAMMFLLGVLAISVVWGVWLAMAVAVASVATYNIFYVPPVRHLDVTHTREWVELAVFLAVAVLASAVVQLARARAVESVERRQEADLLADLSRLMLSAGDLRTVLPEASRRLARALQLPFATVALDSVPDDERRIAFPLRYGSRTGTLLVPTGVREPSLRRLQDRVTAPLATLLTAASERDTMSGSLRELATEQAILRRLAVLVARGAPPGDVVATVAAETAALLEADATRLLRYETPGTVTVIAEHNTPGLQPLLGRQLPVDGGVVEQVLRTSRPARVDSYDDRDGSLADLARHEGFSSSVCAPIVVEGQAWGALVALWSRRPPPPGTEARLAEFAELVATAVANSESQSELRASRARIVLAADAARRSFERDLHDGVQQRLISLGLELRQADELVSDESGELKARLRRTSESLAAAFKDVREISRGLHPAVLSQGGLTSALKALARRSPVPVTIRSGAERRLPGSVEVAAYYVVSEALTNAAKHARASAIDVDVDSETVPGSLVLSIRDNGVGGADPARGSGLVGLNDRVEALGGHLRLTSPAGHGTSLLVTLPTDVD